MVVASPVGLAGILMQKEQQIAFKDERTLILMLSLAIPESLQPRRIIQAAHEGHQDKVCFPGIDSTV